MSEESMPLMGPIFVVGSGRSGTTLLYTLMTGHPDLAWISRLTNRYPRFPWLSLASRWFSGVKYFRPDQEAVRVYDYCGSSRLIRERRVAMTADDVTSDSKSCLGRIVHSHVKWMGKSRFINKNTSNCVRIPYLAAIFPDATFVHIIRNGFAVVNSLLHVEWWPDLELWWLGETPKQWESKGGDQAELAALHWKRQISEVLKAREVLSPNRYVECRYEDLLTDPVQQLKNLTMFCNLTWPLDFEQYISSFDVARERQHGWKKQLDTHAKLVVRRVAGDTLDLLGYEKDII